MTIDELTRQAGEWLSGKGPLADIVISSRIRLARNLAGRPFLPKSTETQRREIQRLLWQVIGESELGNELLYVDIEQTDELDRQVLVERHLISRQHANAQGSRGAVITPCETIALMINEEDHLRMQVLRSGLLLDEAWAEISRIDDVLEQRLDYAFDSRYGYLTACPTNVGTGIRVSVMLHLPGLKMTGEIERVFRAAQDMRLAVRGLFGEGTEAAGDFYQISNQTTLGKREEDIIDEFKHVVIPKIVEYEKRARATLLKEQPHALDDKVWRAYAVLANARMISTDETLALLSHVRMGIHLGRLDRMDLATVNELFLRTQPAHLQKIRGMRMDGAQRRAARAEYIRQRLGTDGSTQTGR